MAEAMVVFPTPRGPSIRVVNSFRAGPAASTRAIRPMASSRPASTGGSRPKSGVKGLCGFNLVPLDGSLSHAIAAIYEIVTKGLGPAGLRIRPRL